MWRRAKWVFVPLRGDSFDDGPSYISTVIYNHGFQPWIHLVELYPVYLNLLEGTASAAISDVILMLITYFTAKSRREGEYMEFCTYWAILISSYNTKFLFFFSFFLK